MNDRTANKAMADVFIFMGRYGLVLTMKRIKSMMKSIF